MSTRVRVVWILIAALALASLVTITLLTRVSDPPECRIPNQQTLAPLSPGVLLDLRWRPDSRLDVDDLRTPTLAQARLPSRFGSGPNRAMWACGWKDVEHTAVIYRSKEPAWRCYGPAEACGEPAPNVWVTCYTVFDQRIQHQVGPRGCLGFPPS